MPDNQLKLLEIDNLLIPDPSTTILHKSHEDTFNTNNHKQVFCSQAIASDPKYLVATFSVW